jgi:hypothetical protein
MVLGQRIPPLTRESASRWNWLLDVMSGFPSTVYTAQVTDVTSQAAGAMLDGLTLRA